MSLNSEMCAFIVGNVELIEQAYSALDEADELLISNMGKFAKKILEESDFFDIIKMNDGEISFSRSKWGKNEKGESLLGFSLDCQGDEGHTWLSVLGGKAPGALAGLYCWYDWSAKGIKRRDWKNYLSDFFINHESLHENGFILNDEGTALMKPFYLDLNCLKKNFLSPDKCFDPLAEAIDAIHSQIKIFDELTKEAKKLAREV